MAPNLDHPFLILIWHILVGYLLTVSIDWNWIPLTKEEKKRGSSLDQVRGKIFGYQLKYILFEKFKSIDKNIFISFGKTINRRRLSKYLSIIMLPANSRSNK